MCVQIQAERSAVFVSESAPAYLEPVRIIISLHSTNFQTSAGNALYDLLYQMVLKIFCSLQGIELVNTMEKIVNDIELESSMITGSSGWLLPLIKRRALLQESAAYISILVLIIMACTYGSSQSEWEGRRRWAVICTFGLSVLEVLITFAVALIYYMIDFQKWAEERRGHRDGNGGGLLLMSRG